MLSHGEFSGGAVQSHKGVLQVRTEKGSPAETGSTPHCAQGQRTI